MILLSFSNDCVVLATHLTGDCVTGGRPFAAGTRNNNPIITRNEIRGNLVNRTVVCEAGAVQRARREDSGSIGRVGCGVRTSSAVVGTRPPLADMRGSTAGLADTLAGGSRAHSSLLAAADALFASVVVAPAVVTYWKGTWTLMDEYVLTDRPVASAAVCAGLGVSIGLFMCVMQNVLSTAFNPDRGRLTYYVCSRMYTCVAGVACVASWRGVWNLLNVCVGDHSRTVLATTAAAMLALAALRGLRNIVAAPFAIVIDSPNDYFDVPTMFRTAPAISNAKVKCNIKTSHKDLIFNQRALKIFPILIDIYNIIKI